MSLEELQFVKLAIPKLIPRHLIEALKGLSFTPEQFYHYQDMAKGNEGNILRALINKTKKIVGFLWCEVNVLDGSLFVNSFSIDKEYWGKGEAMKIAIDEVSRLKDRLKPPKVYWITSNAKFFRKHGLKQSKNVLMEYVA
jgi:hypothetical protein